MLYTVVCSKCHLYLYIVQEGPNLAETHLERSAKGFRISIMITLRVLRELQQALVSSYIVVYGKYIVLDLDLTLLTFIIIDIYCYFNVAHLLYNLWLDKNNLKRSCKLLL